MPFNGWSWKSNLEVLQSILLSVFCFWYFISINKCIDSNACSDTILEDNRISNKVRYLEIGIGWTLTKFALLILRKLEL